MKENEPTISGILLIDKPRGIPSFRLISKLRRRLNIKKIGHSGTLDPFATGLMVMLIGREFTRRSDEFLCKDKEYLAELFLGVSTDTQDLEGKVLRESNLVPSLEEVLTALEQFQGKTKQIPPMFSAKKVKGKKLYELARKGISIEREPIDIELKTEFISYEYPKLELKIHCSKGTYIRTVANDLGDLLGSGAHLTSLRRTRSGIFCISECIDAAFIDDPDFPLISFFKCIDKVK